METVPILSMSSLSGREGRCVRVPICECRCHPTSIPFLHTPSLFSVDVLFSNFCYGIIMDIPTSCVRKNKPLSPFGEPRFFVLPWRGGIRQE